MTGALVAAIAAGCAEEVVHESPQAPISPARQAALAHTSQWLREHTCEIMADAIRVVAPLELRGEAAFNENPKFFERRDKAEPADRPGVAARRRTLFLARNESIQVAQLVLGGVHLSALRRLDVVFDPIIEGLDVRATGKVAWSIDSRPTRRDGIISLRLPIEER